jgi:hypothetical protein
MGILCFLLNIYTGPWNFILGLFLRSLQGIPLTLISLVVSSLVIYLFYKFLGKIGGLILIVIGIAGSFFSAGTTLALTVIGILLFFLSNFVWLIVLINCVIFLASIACSIAS